MQVALIAHLNIVQRALAEVSELVHEAGVAGHYNEAQVEKLKATIENTANSVVEELGKAFAKLESYFEKKAEPPALEAGASVISAASGGEVRPPEPAVPPAPEPSISPEPPPVDPEPPTPPEPPSS